MDDSQMSESNSPALLQTADMIHQWRIESGPNVHSGNLPENLLGSVSTHRVAASFCIP